MSEPAPGAIEEVEMMIDVDEDVDSSASCLFTLTATHAPLTALLKS